MLPSNAVCLVSSDVEIEEYWPECCLCENVVNMAANMKQKRKMETGPELGKGDAPLTIPREFVITE